MDYYTEVFKFEDEFEDDILWIREYKRILNNIKHIDERVEDLMNQRKSQVEQLKGHRATKIAKYD